MTGIMCAMMSVGGEPYTGPYDGIAGSSPGLTGYSLFDGLGTIGPIGYFNNHQIQYLLHYTTGGGKLQFAIGDVVANSGWTTLTVNGVPFNRASATFTNGPDYTDWQWGGAANPFTGGSPYTAVFS